MHTHTIRLKSADQKRAAVVAERYGTSVAKHIRETYLAALDGMDTASLVRAELDAITKNLLMSEERVEHHNRSQTRQLLELVAALDERLTARQEEFFDRLNERQSNFVAAFEKGLASDGRPRPSMSHDEMFRPRPQNNYGDTK